MHYESLSFVDALYLTTTLLSTIGYGDILPTASASRVCVIFFSVSGVVVLGLLIDELAERALSSIRHVVDAIRLPRATIDPYIRVAEADKAQIVKPWSSWILDGASWALCPNSVRPPRWQTPVVLNNQRPVYDVEWVIPRAWKGGDRRGITLEVWDWDRVNGDDKVGSVWIPFHDYAHNIDLAGPGQTRSSVLESEELSLSSSEDEWHQLVCELVLEPKIARNVARAGKEAAITTPRILIEKRVTHTRMFLRIIGADDLPVTDAFAGRDALYTAFDSLKEIVIACLIFLSVVLALAAVYSAIEDWSYFDALWWAFITTYMVGFGDISPQTTTGRALFPIVALFALAIRGYVISVATNLYNSHFAARTLFDHDTQENNNNSQTTSDSDDDDEGGDRTCAKGPCRTPAYFCWHHCSGSPSKDEARDLFIILLALIVLAILALPMSAHEDWTWLETASLSFQVWSSVGYGDITPATTGGKLFVIFLGTVSTVLLALAVAIITKQRLANDLDGISLSNEGDDDSDDDGDSDTSDLMSTRYSIAYSSYDEQEEEEEEEERRQKKKKKKRSSAFEKKAVRASVRASDRRGKKRKEGEMGGGKGGEETPCSCSRAACYDVMHWSGSAYVVLMAVYLALNVVGAGVFYALEDHIRPYGITFYYAIVTSTTTGLGDYSPKSSGGQVFFMFFITVSYALYAYLLTLFERASTEILEAKVQNLAFAELAALKRIGHTSRKSTKAQRRLNKSHTMVLGEAAHVVGARLPLPTDWVSFASKASSTGSSGGSSGGTSGGSDDSEYSSS